MNPEKSTNSLSLVIPRIQCKTQILRNNTLELIKSIPLEEFQYDLKTRNDLKKSIENLQFIIPLLKSVLKTLLKTRFDSILN
jgi:hypothetical protein